MQGRLLRPVVSGHCWAFVSCTIWRNGEFYEGGGVYSCNSSPTLTNCTVCVDAGTGDANADSATDLSDAVAIPGHLFLGGKPPGEPPGSCGVDPTPDELTCESFAGCP